jgi:hypothetical protein
MGFDFLPCEHGLRSGDEVECLVWGWNGRRKVAEDELMALVEGSLAYHEGWRAVSSEGEVVEGCLHEP